MRSEEEIRRLLEALKEAWDNFEDSDFKPVDFCVDCRKIVTGEEASHSVKGHTVVFSDWEHDGIGEWIRALEWVLGEEAKEK